MCWLMVNGDFWDFYENRGRFNILKNTGWFLELWEKLSFFKNLPNLLLLASVFFFFHI